MKFPQPRHKVIRMMLNLLAAALCFALIRLTGKGESNIPRQGPYILAPNHVSVIDPVVLSATIKPSITFLMAQDLTDLSLLESLIPWAYGAFLVDRKHPKLSAVKALQKQIQHKEVICIFPEGAVVRAGLQANPAKNGVAFLAVKNAIPIIPVAIYGTENIISGWKKMQRAKVGIHFGEPIFPRQEDRQNLPVLTEEIMRAIRKMLPASYA